MVLTQACSLALDLPLDDHKCDPAQRCTSGYTCLANVCIKNGSITEGDTCLSNEICQTGLICVYPEHLCRRECTSAFAQSSAECPANYTCIPAHDEDGNAKASCVPNNCDHCQGDQSTSEKCVNLDSSTQLCLYTCSIACSGSPSSCTPTCSDINEACQPLGSNNIFTCVAGGSLPHGSTCDLRARLCEPSSACIRTVSEQSGICVAYCALNNSSSCAGRTDPFTSTAATCKTFGSQTGLGVCGTVP
jgi:hypothetical protein